jgi:hypothetical protein
MVLVKDMGGFLGLGIVFAFIAALAVGIAASFHPLASFLIALLLVPSAGARPLTLSLLLFSLLWFVLQKLQRGIGRR